MSLDLEAIESHWQGAIFGAAPDLMAALAEVRKLRKIVLYDHSNVGEWESKRCYQCGHSWPCDSALAAGFE